MTDETKNHERRNDESETPAVQVPTGEKVYILVDGLKSGPFSKEEIVDMVQSRDLLVTDSVSVDGHSWFNLHQWSEFDRRSSHSEDLPGIPKVNLFTASDQEVDQSLESENEELIERDAMAGLAYLGNINNGKRAQHHNDKYANKDETKADIDNIPDLDPVDFQKSSSKKETYVWGAVLSLALAGILYVFLSPGAPNKVVKTKAEPMVKRAIIKPRKPASTAKNNRAISNANKAKKVVKARSRKPSFTKSKAFKNRAPRRVPAAKKIEKPVVEDPDDYYYDDGTDPVELDPVRSKLAKETFDPEDENLDEYLDEVDAEREPASQEEDPEKAFEALYE